MEPFSWSQLGLLFYCINLQAPAREKRKVAMKLYVCHTISCHVTAKSIESLSLCCGSHIDHFCHLPNHIGGQQMSTEEVINALEERYQRDEGNRGIKPLIRAVGSGELYRAVKCALQPKIEHVVIITGDLYH